MSDKDYMNDKQLEFFRNRLTEMEAELRHNAGQTTENLRESTVVPDPADRATIEEEHALELRTRDRERIDTSKPKNPNTLYYGCEGTKVKSLQQMLKKVGCYKGAIDGVYGDLTYEAVKKYQYQKGLHADGMAGSKTLSSLRKNTQKK